LVTLVADLLAKDPVARPADARDVIHRLRRMDVTTSGVRDDDIAAVWWQKHAPLVTSEASATGSKAQSMVPTGLSGGVQGALLPTKSALAESMPLPGV